MTNMTVIDEIAAERLRQIEVEGWTPEHDDNEHEAGDLSLAAASYAAHAAATMMHEENPLVAAIVKAAKWLWPWSQKWWKPKNCRSDLVRAGALIVAEIERIDRIAAAIPAHDIL